MDREEAIRRIKAWNLDLGDREVLAVVVPELAESEDEKTRKELLEEIESIIPHEDETDSEGLILPSYHTRIDRYKSYLEKQKEYELTEEDKKIIPEALVMLCDDIINHRVHTPIKTDEEGARKIKAFLKTFNRQPHKTMKEWEKQKEQKPAEWSEEDEEMYARVVRRYTDYEGVIMRTKEESVAAKMLDAMAQEEIWLQSLRPSWKPSEEQMKALKEVAYNIVGTGTETDVHLVQLYEQLKRL